MSLRRRLFRKTSSFFYFILLVFVIIVIAMHAEIHQYSPYPLCSFLNNPSTSSPSASLSPNTTDERTVLDHLWIWCPEIESHLDDEKEILKSPRLRSPLINDSQYYRLPYHYSRWKSSPLLPRRITPCEHYLTMHLLMIIHRVCIKHNLTFAMSDGTLLGSWRHHDIIPWDDDVDLIMPIEDQLNFLRALEQFKDTVIQYYLIEYPLGNQPFAKVFFQFRPFAVQTTWTFPFVDIFFYLTNENTSLVCQSSRRQHAAQTCLSTDHASIGLSLVTGTSRATTNI